LKLRGVVALDFDKTIGMMVSSRKYVLSSKWCKPNSGLDPSLTALVWKSRTSLHAFTGEDLGRTLYGNPTYRYHHIEPDIMKVPLLERDDFYDCHDEFPEGEGGDDDADVQEVGEDGGGDEADEDEPFYTPESDTEGEQPRGTQTTLPSSWARIQHSLKRRRHTSPAPRSPDELADELGAAFVALT